MPLSRAELLRPSLSGSDRLRRAPYSLQAGFLSAFFGGPFAAAGLFAVNAWRLGRARSDAPAIAGMLLAALVFALGSGPGGAIQSALQPVAQWLGPRTGIYAERLFALALFGIGAALHRREQRSVVLFGLRRPNGWIGGLAAIVGGNVVSTLIALWITPVPR